MWTPAQLAAVLGEEEAEALGHAYGITPDGNFEGATILHLPRRFTSEAWSPEDPSTVRQRALLARLRDAREKRVRPGRDDKVIVAWNGLMISALARASQAFEEPRFLDAARGAADFILSAMIEEGTLHRTWRRGQLGPAGFLDDYAALMNALIDLYESDFDEKWLLAARELATETVKRFGDPEAGGLFRAASDHDDLLVRSKPFYDGAVPSGNALSALALLRLSRLTGDNLLAQEADRILAVGAPLLSRFPGGHLRLLLAFSFRDMRPQEAVLVGRRGAEDTIALTQALHQGFRPATVLAFVDPDHRQVTDQRLAPARRRELVEGQAAVYLCEGQACRKPMTDPGEVARVFGFPSQGHVTDGTQKINRADSTYED